MSRTNTVNTTTDVPSRETTADGQAPAHRPAWTFLTNHAHVLIAVARNPNMLVHDIAETVGITQRGTLHILADLEEAGYIHRLKSGRRTHYTVEEHEHFRHPSTAHQEIGALLGIFAPGASVRSTREPGASIEPQK